MADFPTAVLNELNTCGIACNNLRLSLFSLVSAPLFDSLQQLRGHKMWQARAEVFATTAAVIPASFNLDTLPLDGTTIQPRHFELIWTVFGFPGQSFPSPRHRAVLLDISVTRNRVAHGEDEPERVGRQRTMVDVTRAAQVVDEFAEHACLNAETYLQQRLYMR
jgi:hypothetical protein